MRIPPRHVPERRQRPRTLSAVAVARFPLWLALVARVVTGGALPVTTRYHRRQPLQAPFFGA